MKMEEKIKDKASIGRLHSFLVEERRKGNIKEDPSFLLEPNRDKDLTYKIVMTYIKSSVLKKEEESVLREL
jgi:hypothetical protein